MPTPAEIGLSGAVRPVAHTGLRLKEAAKLGFSRAIAPASAHKEASEAAKLTLSHVSSVASLVAQIAEAGIAGNKDRNRVTK